VEYQKSRIQIGTISKVFFFLKAHRFGKPRRLERARCGGPLAGHQLQAGDQKRGNALGVGGRQAVLFGQHVFERPKPQVVDVLQLPLAGEVVAAILAGLRDFLREFSQELDALGQVVFVALVAVTCACSWMQHPVETRARLSKATERKIE